jgi:hypothetical protein
MELDRLVPTWDVEKRHNRTIEATPDDVWDSLIALDFNQSRLVRALMLARGIRRRSLGWKEFERFGFVPLHRDRPRELVLGLVAQPWRITGGVQRTDSSDFATFDEPGFAVIGWNYVLHPDASGTNVTTITRIRCTDRASWVKFRRYWMLVGPFSGVIRTQSLRLLARDAESRAG